MRNVFIVIQHEVVTMLNKRSFWLTTFLLPAVIFVLSFGSQALSRSVLAQDGSNPLVAGSNSGSLPAGYVDQAGLIKQVPSQPPAGAQMKIVRLRAYPDQAAAQAALDSGKIGRYYVVPADFIATGNLLVVDSQFSAINSLDNNDYFEYVIRLNLTGSPNVALMLADPTADMQQQGLAPQGRKEQDSLAAYGVPFAALFIFYFVITLTSGFMLQSVTKEKENRTVEVLLLSVRPRDLMLGKILGLGLVALLQIAIWAGGSILLTHGGQSGSLSGLPAGFLGWALLYFVLGYLLYASVLGAIGALAPTAREGAQFTFIAMLPLFVTLMLSNALIESPNSGLAVFLSLFPLTAPTGMITRLAAAPVPIEQLILGLVLLAITSYLFVLLASRFFRADTLLSFSSLNLRRIVQEFRR